MRKLLLALGAVSLLMVAGCDDDTTAADGGQDLSVPHDLKQGPDLEVPHDMTLPPGDGGMIG